jgi:hypothetical protein
MFTTGISSSLTETRRRFFGECSSSCSLLHTLPSTLGLFPILPVAETIEDLNDEERLLLFGPPLLLTTYWKKDRL